MLASIECVLAYIELMLANPASVLASMGVSLASTRVKSRLSRSILGISSILSTYSRVHSGCLIALCAVISHHDNLYHLYLRSLWLRLYPSSLKTGKALWWMKSQLRPTSSVLEVMERVRKKIIQTLRSLRAALK